MRMFERFFLGVCFIFTFGTVAVSAVYCSSQQEKNKKYVWNPNIETSSNIKDLKKIFNTIENDGKLIITGLVDKNNVSDIKIPSFINKNGVKVPVDISEEFIKSLESKRSEVKSLTIGGQVNLDLLANNGKGNYFNRLEKLEFENGIKKIPNNLFVTTTLKEIKLPNSIEIIDSQAFRNTAIKEIELPNTIKELLSQSFAFTTKLEKVTFRPVEGKEPSKTMKIGSSVFEQTALTNFEFPSSLQNVDFEFTIHNELFFTFYDCENLKKIKSSSGVKDKYMAIQQFKTYIETKKISWN